LCLLALLCVLPVAHAGLSFELLLIREQQGTSYYFYTELRTNSTLPAAALGNYLIASPQQPTNGSWRQFDLTTNGLNVTGGGNNSFGNFDSVLQQITNGNWTILLTNATTTNLYQFTVSAPTLTSNMLPVLIVTLPAENQILETNQPTLTWQWPASWGVNSDAFVFNDGYSFFQYDSLPEAQNSWFMATPLPIGENLHIQLRYTTNYPTPLLVATTPRDTNSAQPISGWVSTSTLQAIENVNFSVSAAASSGGEHTLIARYTFDDSGNLGQDSSDHGNDMNGGSSWGPLHEFATDAAAGGGAVEFFGTSSITPSDSTRTNWNMTLAGSFSISAWVKTTASRGNDDDNASFGASIFWAFNDHNATNDTIPLAITGSKAAFTTRDGAGNFTTLHSGAIVNDGNYHLITVTRNHSTGEKKVYVDGNFEASEIGTTEPLNGNDYYLSVGGTALSSYSGLLDDVQIYSGVLSANEVTSLHSNPGSTVTNTTIPLDEALNATNLTWTTSGDANWFGQTTNTHDNVSAAQSGAIGDNGQTWIETTVAGPGTLSFWWKVSSEGGYDFLEFLTDGNSQTNMSGDSGWQQQTYPIGAGSHTLRWNYFKDGNNSDLLDAGFLDEVSFVATPPPDTNTPPIITVNPFSQTNHPGYSVALFAGATSNAAITWEWFKVGSPSPIPNATNTLLIPANSGSAGVAGDYFAIATNAFGSATTLVATVTFQSAALPPDWSRAFTAPFTNDPANTTSDINLASLFDSAGNIYTVGSVNGTNVFGTNTLISANGVEGSSFLKQTAAGTPIWGRCMTNNGNGSSFPRCIAAAPGDGFYAMGLFFGTNWLGTNKLVDVAGGSTYLVRFDANGSNVWVRTIVGTNFNFPTHHTLVSDPAGNVTLSALISGYTTLGASNVTATGQQGVLAQFDPNGNVRWVQFPSAWPSYLTYNGGRIYGSMGGGSTNYIGGVTNISDRRQALFSLNATNGQGFWVQGIAAEKDQGNPSGFGSDDALVAVSGTNVFVAGASYGSNAVFGPFSVTFPTGTGQYFARYDTNGNAQLATSFGSQFTWPWAALADASGNVYIGADFDTYSVFGSNIIAAPFYETVQYIGSIDNRIPGQACVAKFDRNGNPLWASPAQSPSSYLNLRDITLASDGVWACGFFKPIGNFGTNTIYGGTPPYHVSGYLAKITDGVALPLPVTLLNPGTASGNFRFSFQSLSGSTYTVLSRTNAAAGVWQTSTVVSGDGTTKLISIPLTNSQRFFRVRSD
jgi:Concanavalin A-like lectin/glucanases superfamily